MAAHALPDCAGCRSVCGASQVAVCEAVAGWVYVSDSFASSTCYSLPRCRCRLGDGGMESDGYNGDDFTAKARSSSPVCQASHTAGNRTTQTATNTYFQALRTMVPNPSAIRKLGDRRTPTTDGVDPSVRPYAVTAVASP